MRANRTKRRLLLGETVFGCALQCYRSSEIPRAFAAAGFDWFFIDMEHAGFNSETAQDIIAAAVASQITPLVRVAELQYSLVARLLDLGAQGIVLPRVEDPAKLAETLSWMLFPPYGKRGFGILPPVLDYKQETIASIIEHHNSNKLAVVQFETHAAMQRADELLSVQGIDVAMIGPTDLSVSLGIPGDFENPMLVEMVQAFIEKCDRHGVVPGIHCRNVSQARPWLARGMRLIGCGSEQSMLIEKSKQTVLELRSAAAIPMDNGVSKPPEAAPAGGEGAR
jgi:2-keto-3-deoxy-L-rhamnonate aldolase RhmA